MALIKSISGIRGTIGGEVESNLTPIDIVQFTAAFGTWLKSKTVKPKIVLGRDGRISGPMVSSLVTQTLIALGIDVLDLGMSTTPTVEMAVPHLNANAGIIITASHNGKEYNALKFVNESGEFVSDKDGKEFLSLIGTDRIVFSSVDSLGSYSEPKGMIDYHIEQILKLELVKPELIRSKNYKIVVDAINSSGAMSVPPLLKRLGCECILINGEMNGNFAHHPEPLPEHLSQLKSEVIKQKADLGIVVDPDVDRLAFITEKGNAFGEEYTLVAVADYVLKNNERKTSVSNLSSTRALSDVTIKHGGTYHASAVGEVNVVNLMKNTKAVIGGEGNGGIIVPELHYGRDALAGIALFLSHLATENRPVSSIKSDYPNYIILKNSVDLSDSINFEYLLSRLTQKYKFEKLNLIDGLKIDLDDGWIHLRMSNTEPIIRIYTESHSEVIAENFYKKIVSDINEIQREQ